MLRPSNLRKISYSDVSLTSFLGWLSSKTWKMWNKLKKNIGCIKIGVTATNLKIIVKCMPNKNSSFNQLSYFLLHNPEFFGCSDISQLHNPHRSSLSTATKYHIVIDWQCSDISTFIHVLGSNPTNTGTVVHNSLHCSNILIIHYIAKGINLTKSTLRLEDDISKAGMYLCSPNVWTFQTNFIKYIYCIANTTELKYQVLHNIEQSSPDSPVVQKSFLLEEQVWFFLPCYPPTARKTLPTLFKSKARQNMAYTNNFPSNFKHVIHKLQV